MNRFSDFEDSNYRLVCGQIVRFVDGALGRVNGYRTCERYRSCLCLKLLIFSPALPSLQSSLGEHDASSYMGSLSGLTLQELVTFGERDGASV